MKGVASALLLAFATPALAAAAPAVPAADTRLAVEFRFTATARAQIALWVEKPDGTFMGTVRLTQAVGVRGIGNRPGASQMNSGFRWPYGRRLDVLPVWAHRRASAAGAAQFGQVIFQHRTSEGCASNAGCGGTDSSVDSYFCLSFMVDTTRQAALDAVSCASVFSSDKGRFMTADDMVHGYSEPTEAQGVGVMRPLELTSPYPPRRDDEGCAGRSTCVDDADAASYSAHARQVMPDIDAITMATPPADVEQSVLFTIPESWSDPEYVAWIEVNVEGDHNAAFSDEAYRTPALPTGAWDSWAGRYGYPYRGQPSVVYRVPFSLRSAMTVGTTTAVGYGDFNGFGQAAGQLHAMDGLLTNDPENQTDPPTPGSGVDRLRVSLSSGYRFQVTARDAEFCQGHSAPEVPAAVNADPDTNERHSHQWGHLHFVVPNSVFQIDHYEVRYAKSKITPADPSTFDQALPAMAAETDTVALMVPTTGAAGTAIDVRFGGMEPLTQYFIAVRAVDTCNVAGPYAVADLTTTRINFTRLSGCFVATAAYGSAMEPEVEALRTVRDAVRTRSVLAAAATDLYYRSGPAAAAVIGRSDLARALVRSTLRPLVDAARATTQLMRR